MMTLKSYYVLLIKFVDIVETPYYKNILVLYMDTKAEAKRHIKKELKKYPKNSIISKAIVEEDDWRVKYYEIESKYDR